jgi:hypothetical protein
MVVQVAGLAGDLQDLGGVGEPELVDRDGLESADLEFVEKLLTSAMVALLDGTEREHATRVPHRRIAGRAGYRFRLLVALVVVAAVEGKLSPSS